jgi:hypothetical protein
MAESKPKPRAAQCVLEGPLSCNVQQKRASPLFLAEEGGTRVPTFLRLQFATGVRNPSHRRRATLSLFFVRVSVEWA